MNPLKTKTIMNFRMMRVLISFVFITTIVGTHHAEAQRKTKGKRKRGKVNWSFQNQNQRPKP